MKSNRIAQKKVYDFYAYKPGFISNILSFLRKLSNI